MKRIAFLASVLLLFVVAVAAFTDGFKRIKQKLTGYEEVPSVSTGASGEFKGRISNAEDQVEWSLSYSELEGSVQQAHIHFGQKGVNGGITVFLCTNLGNGPAGIQPCPASPAMISGVLTSADISPNIPATAAARTQGINTGEFEEFLAAMRAGSLYVNVHSTTWPGGEVRSQIDAHEGNHGRNDK
jgi:hypothetical protein